MDEEVSDSRIAPLTWAILINRRQHDPRVRRQKPPFVHKNCVATERGSVCLWIANWLQIFIGVRVNGEALFFCTGDGRIKRILCRFPEVKVGLLKCRLPTNYPA